MTQSAPSPSPPRQAAVPGPGGVSVVPVTHRGRPVGAFVITTGGARFLPVVDTGRLVLAASVVAVAGAAAVAVTRRPPGPAIRTVSMGPGGWISLRGLPARSPRAASPARPWWARLLRARRLVAER
ncbi:MULTISPECIES: hypothetical protein [Catenuloplanes]|uniref:Uncharacterized protein n=1 Tax=Catenuloplanes niger TaxID=587534 RepID=A0AAE3ZZL6_9ACTN|nr:hypothetical protein [Catenuloplanes niger]MDR7327741.1 hypothetical protein [Catenuloplanes niger]